MIQVLTRIEHLAWAKQRALALCDKGNLQDAYSSMVADLVKHPDTQTHTGIELGSIQMLGGHLNTKEKMRDFIEGFN